MKDLDFIPLLYEDKKQNSRALRADVQNTPLGPEVMLAAPLYDGVDFLGVVVAYFDMRALMQYSGSPENMVILSPQALLWPGKYDFAATPLAGVDWSEVVSKVRPAPAPTPRAPSITWYAIWAICPWFSPWLNPAPSLRARAIWSRVCLSSPRNVKNCRPRRSRSTKIRLTCPARRALALRRKRALRPPTWARRQNRGQAVQ